MGCINTSHSCLYHRTTMSTGTTYKLNNGVEIPAVGFGTFASEGAKGESYKAVQVALKTGYRHLDCAWFYQNEGEVGEAVRDFLKENPSPRRVATPSPRSSSHGVCGEATLCFRRAPRPLVSRATSRFLSSPTRTSTPSTRLPRADTPAL